MGSRGIWAFMSARTRRSLTLSWTALFVLSLLLQYFTFAAAPSVLAVHDEGLFELDGDTIANNASAPIGPADDWDSHPGATGNRSIFITDGLGLGDNIFTGGSTKDDLNTTGWKWTTGSVQDKNDIEHAYAVSYEKSGHTFVYFGLDRFSNNGDAFTGFWFFKNGISANANGSFSPAHTVGDLLVQADFTNGGASSTINLYEWVGSGGDTNGTLDKLASGQVCTGAPVDDKACAVTNQAPIDPSWTFDDKGTPGSNNLIPAESFFEGGIDLDDLFGGNAPCFSSFLAETRSSQSVDSTLSDFATGDFNTCVPPTIATQSNSTTADFGGTVTDTATFSGNDGPVTGTATFFICTPAQITAAGCPSGGAQVGAVKTISSGSATSDAYTVGLTSAAVGKYCWRVEYAPDQASQYLAATHTNATTECFTVAPATIAITKVANPVGPVNAGDPLGFDITVTNTGTGTALNVAVNDPLPAGVDWTLGTVTGGASCSITGPVGTEVLGCTKASLAAGASFSAHISGPTDAADCPTVTNVDAHVTTSNDGDAHASASVTVNCPDVTVAKTPDAGSINAGSTAQFTIVVTNLGPGLARNVTLHDPLPGNIDWSDDSAQCDVTGAVGSQVLDCNFGDMISGATATVHVSGLTDKNDCGPLNNTATVGASNEAAAQQGNNSDNGAIEVLCANIGIAKTANPAGPVSAGDEIGFDVSVTNSGTGAATDVHVSDPLPAGVTWTLGAVTGDTTGVSCQITGAPGSQALTCDDDTMASGDSFSVHVSAQTDATDCGTIDNTASVSTGNDGAGEASASVDVQCPDLEVVKEGNGTIDAGEDAVFTITLTNHGPGAAHDVTLEDQLPAGSWTLGGANAGDCSIDGSNLLTCDFGTVASGDTRTITLTLATTADNCGTIPNSVTVGASNEPDNDQFPNTDDASITVNCPDITVVKEAAVSPISAGENASFTITVTNVGTGTAENVTLSDQLDGSGWSLGGADAGDCSINASNLLTCDFGNLAEGESRTFSVSRETTFDDCGELPNAVTVSASNELEDFLDNNSDDATIVVNCPDLGIVKTADHETAVIAGDQIGFTITVANNGDGTAFDVHVSDTLPAGFSWSIESQSQDPAAPAINDFVLVGAALSFTGDLPAGAQISVHVVADTDFEDCGLVPNTAFLTQGETAVDNDSASEDVRCPEIGIDKTSNDEDGIVDGGQVVTFTILGSVVDGPVTDAVVTDTLPAGQTYVDGSESSTPAESAFTVSADGRTLTWTYASLNDGDPAVTITYDVTIDAAAEGALNNVAELCVSELPNCESDDVTVNPNPELGIQKSNNAPLVDGLPTAAEGDTVTYTLDYTVLGEVHNAVITDVLPTGVTYVDGTATDDAQFTFASYNPVTRTLTWNADTVSENGSLSYDATIDEGAAELVQPLVNVATIDSDETEPASDNSPVFVAPVPLELTPPPTDTLAPSAPASNPGFALMLLLLSVAAIALAIGFITPVPEHVRRRDRLG
jgi:uncharacterized repeat protein (TIGR01451 family)/fimbrial isopeptide formation D2 family protein